MSALRAQLLQAARAESAPKKLRDKVLRSARFTVVFGPILGAARAVLLLGGTVAFGYFGAGHTFATVPESTQLHSAPLVLASVVSEVPTIPSASLPMQSTELAMLFAEPKVGRQPPLRDRQPVATTSLRDELKLLDEIHRAVRRGDDMHAQKVLSQHRRLYPASALTQERMVLEVEILVLRGNHDSAERLVRSLRHQYPSNPALDRLTRLVAR